MELAAFASFAVLVLAWVVLPMRGTAEPTATIVATEAIAEPAAA